MEWTTVSGFDWDDGNRARCRKHGLKLAEVEAVFAHPHRIAPDRTHSASEDRYLAIGTGGGPRPIFVAFTLRATQEALTIRPISARFMHRKEIESYEKAFAHTDK